MLHFFGPYVPVDIVVPADREEVARESLEAATPVVSKYSAEPESGQF